MNDLTARENAIEEMMDYIKDTPANREKATAFLDSFMSHKMKYIQLDEDKLYDLVVQCFAEFTHAINKMKIWN